MREKRRRRRRRRIFLGSVLGALTLLAAAYCGIAVYFSSHFFFRTKVNGWKIGGMDIEAAEEKLGKSVEEYLLTIYDRDGEKHHIYGEDIECEYVPDGSVEKLLKDEGFSARLAGKEDIKRLYAVYFVQNITQVYFDDYDGARFVKGDGYF